MTEVFLNASNIATHVSSQSLVHVISREHISTSEKVEKDCSKTEHVGLIAVAFLAFEHFRSYIARSATFVRQRLVILSEDCETKVSDSDLVLRVVFNCVNEDILRLNVSMHYLFPLKEVQCKKHLFKDHSHVRLFKGLARLKSLKESAIRLIFEYHIHRFIVFKELKEAHNTHALLQRPVDLDLIQKEL